VAVFDTAWWDRRTMPDGLLRNGRIPLEDKTGRAAWRYWRLADDLMQRHYRHLGLEVGFGLMGDELYQALVWSPWCARRPTTYGRFCGIHVHRDIDGPNFPPPLPGPTQENCSAGLWPSWAAFRNAKLADLGLREAYRPGHEQCFHRRGASHLPAIYRIGLLVRTNFGRSPFTGRAKHTRLTTRPVPGSTGVDEQLRELLRDCQDVTAARWPQGFLLTHEENPLAYLRGNGDVLLAMGERLNAGELLLAGVGIEEIARTLADRIFGPSKKTGTVTRGMWRTQPLHRPQRLPVPDVAWSDQDWERIRGGVLPEEMEDKWFAFTSEGRLNLVRSWTGYTIYEAGFWRISDLLVTGDRQVYDKGADDAETSHVVQLINGILLHRW
jgi:hypothetical protein